jgi:hypothetical protein
MAKALKVHVPDITVTPGDAFEVYHNRVTGKWFVYRKTERLAEYNTRREADLVKQILYCKRQDAIFAMWGTPPVTPLKYGDMMLPSLSEQVKDIYPVRKSVWSGG